VSAEFLGKRQQLTGVPRPASPIDDGLVLPEFCYLAKPLSPTLIRDHNHIGNIARSETAADGQLNPFKQASRTPLVLQPVDRNGRFPIRSVSTAAPLAHHNVTDNESLCDQ
jgi:hypothetical protein